jgi:DNA-binding GntR family transcriptional regulator
MSKQARWREVYGILRRQILTLEREPNSRISESGLATEFQASQTPVRDALGRLVQEGLVVTGGERGYWVAPLDPRNMQELAEFRFLLERGVAELLIGGSPDWDRARHLSAALRNPGMSAGEVVDANIEFHTGLAEMAGNTRLAATLRRVLEDSARYFRLGLNEISASDMADDHELLLDALHARDMAQAGELYRHEAYGTRDRVLRIMMQSPTGSLGLILTPTPAAHRTAHA